MVRIVFWGSGQYAVPAFKALVDAGHEMAALVLPPAGERERGEGPETYASAWRFPVLEPEAADQPELETRIGKLAPDVMVVVGARPSLPRKLREVPRFNTVRVHFSLLPRHRGPAPVACALLEGDEETGVTLLHLDENPDTGPVLASRSVRILEQETCGELETRLAALAKEMLVKELPLLGSRKDAPVSQKSSEATEAPLPTAADGELDWALTAQELHRRVRAFEPWPGSTTPFRGGNLRVLRAAVGQPGHGGEPGVIRSLDFQGIHVACGGGTTLRLTMVQPDGQRPMSPSAFAATLHVGTGTRLG